jgi:succinoglycan biosynthesis transport protein ExoP
MMPPDRVPTDGRPAADWRRARMETSALQSYYQVLRERWRLIVATMLVTTLAAVAYLATAEPTYEAEADLLITPVSSDDTTTEGLPLIRDSNDPLRNVETAARLATSRNVAARVKQKLGLPEDPDEIAGDVSAEPVASSNIVAITATADSADEAAALANAFGEGAVEQRNADLRRELDRRIPDLRERIAAGEGELDTGGDSLATELAKLESLRAGGDPTMRLQTRADAPDGPSSPKPKLTIASGIIAGLLLGVGGAFALNAIDPRLRREEQLRERFSLPILARVPRERRPRSKAARGRRLGRHRERQALSPVDLSPATLEAYRTLRAMLAASSYGGRGRDEGRSILVTGPSPSEGKTTTAINLASTLALAGNQVILIEADFRRPTVGRALGVEPTVGIGKVLLGDTQLEDALVSTKLFGDNLRVLLVDQADAWLAEVLSLPAATGLLDKAKRLAEYVVVDSPPLTEVIDALPLAKQVDDVVIVVRLGTSNLGQLSRLGDLLAQNDVRPNGFVVVGVGSSEDSSYYLAGRRERDMGEWVLPGSGAPADEPARAGRVR